MMRIWEPSTTPTTYGIQCISWNPCAYFFIMRGVGHLMNFFSKLVFIARQNWEIVTWLEERPILYQSGMHCIELHVANLEIATATFTWTGMANRMFVFRLCKSGARVLHKYSDVDTSVRMRPLNSLAVNESKRFWSKKPGRCKPLSWAHNRRCCLPFSSLNPMHCKCHATHLLPMSQENRLPITRNTMQGIEQW